MRTLSFTLVSEGPSDRALVPIITWLIHQHAEVTIQPEWADLAYLTNPPRDLGEKIAAATQLYPCDLLFVHRDADRSDRRARVREIRRAAERALGDEAVPAVCVIPVRALEAWLLLDESAIRRASGNPNGTQDLNLPAAKHIENLPDPKATLNESIRRAADQRRRRRRKVRPGRVLHRIAELIDDFATLRSLEAFKAFEEELVETLDRHDWIQGHGSKDMEVKTWK